MAKGRQRIEDLDLNAPYLAEREKFKKQQRDFFDYVQMGMDLIPAARKAGYKNANAFVTWVKKTPRMRDELEKRWEENRKKMQITREKVQEMVLEAYEVAKLTSDPSSMVRACSELNRMSGFYELDRSQMELNKSQQELLSRLNELSDEELLAMSNEVEVIDVEQEQDAEAEALLTYTEAEYEEEDGDDSQGR